MQKQYIISKPSDFKIVINDLLTWAGKQETSLIIALSGELGAGKTAFTQELGKVLGVSDAITSPTFTIMKQYSLIHKSFDELVHIDAYRIESEDELGPLRIVELLNQPRIIACVEWPEQMSKALPTQSVSLVIEISDSEKRIVSVTFPS